MKDILPLFSSHYSYLHSILTLEEAGKTELGNPISICDIAVENQLDTIIIIDDKIDGYIEAYKNISKLKKNLFFGVKMSVCSDENDKTPESVLTESNIIIFIDNTDGYSDLIRIYNRAWNDNFYNKGRTSWRQLKEFWTPNLKLALPFFSSFLAKNMLTFSNIVPDFPMLPILFIEVDSGIPFAPIIEQEVNKFASSSNLEIQLVKSIYYQDSEKDFETYMNLRAIETKSTFGKPNIDHLCSNKFSFSNWKKLIS